MKVTLCKNLSEKNTIGKNLTGGVDYTGNLRDASNVIKPAILVAVDNPTEFNYAVIEEFGRKYFIDEIQSVRTGIWLIQMSVDVLESFKDGILGLTAIISDTEHTGESDYVAGEQWATTVKNKTTILQFPNGLLESGQYILITAGG